MEFLYEEEKKKAESVSARKFGEKLALSHYKEAPIPERELLEKKHGIVIEYRKLSDGISAIVKFDKKQIILNETMHPNHQRFTLAHELGHIELNHEERQFTEYAAHVGQDSDKPWEVEANAFAAGFLMPGKLLRKALKEGYKPDQMVKLFKVSEYALWISIKTHRLLNKL